MSAAGARRRLPHVLIAMLVFALTVGGLATGKGKRQPLPRNSVATKQIKNGAVTQPKLAGGSVSTDQLQNGAVTEPKIAAGAVGTPEIATGAVAAGEIARDAVGSAEIADGSVGPDDLAPGTIPAPGAPATEGFSTFVPSSAAISTNAGSPTGIAALSSLPAGAYFAAASFWIDAPNSAPVVTCTLASGGQQVQQVKADTFGLQQVPVSLQGATSLQGELQLTCSANQPNVQAKNVSLVSMRLGSLTQQ